METVLALPDDEDLTPLLEQYDGQTFDVKLRDRRLFKDGNWTSTRARRSSSNKETRKQQIK